MGTRFIFKCPSCEYKAKVSGGNDIGMLCATSTILCETCKTLDDVVTTNEPWLAMEPEWTPKHYNCRKSEKHPCRLWTYTDSCPKCNTEMERDETEFVSWD